ncbi:branched-chain amino acid ABC transporter permease [soil metagenome]
MQVFAILRDHPGLRHILLALLGAVVAAAVLAGASEFRATQLSSVAYLATAAAGLTILTGLNGQLSLGHGAFMAIGAYTAALMLQDAEPVAPLPLVLLSAAVVATVAGFVVGLAAARLSGPYLAGATLALAVAVPGLAIFFGETLGGEQGLSIRVPDAPDWFADTLYLLTAVDPSRGRYIAFVSWVVLIVVLVLLANLAASRVGRTWRAVRDDEIAAQLAGIDVARSRITAFTVSAACAGIAGGVMALVVRIAAPSGFTLTLSMTLVAAIVIGGLGTLTGALIGAGLLTFLPQLATDAGGNLGFDDVQSAQLAPLVYGLVMMLVVLLSPGGLVGLARRAPRPWRRAPATPPETPSGPTDPPSAEESDLPKSDQHKSDQHKDQGTTRTTIERDPA